MPINNIQFRAEIGIFNSVNRPYFRRKCCFLQLLLNNIKNISIVMRLILFNDTKLYYFILIHLICFLTTFMVYPFVFGLNLIFSEFMKSYITFFNLYIYVYISLLFFVNILWLPIVYHKASAKLLTRYCLFFQICFFLPYIKHALLISGDIETNPGPANLDNQNFSICHWNLNGITANNYIKMCLLEAYNAVHDFDVICLSETFLNSDYQKDEPLLNLQGYTMIRSDHPSGTKRGGVCIYYKEHLPFVNRTDITFLDECIVGEIRIKNKKCFITCIYRSPNQTLIEVDDFSLQL